MTKKKTKKSLVSCRNKAKLLWVYVLELKQAELKKESMFSSRQWKKLLEWMHWSKRTHNYRNLGVKRAGNSTRVDPADTCFTEGQPQPWQVWPCVFVRHAGGARRCFKVLKEMENLAAKGTLCIWRQSEKPMTKHRCVMRCDGTDLVCCGRSRLLSLLCCRDWCLCAVSRSVQPSSAN